MKKEIIIASENYGKIKEFQEILKEYKIVSMNQLGIEIEVEENGKTIRENAIKKAEIIAKKLNGRICLADDTGIEIEFLDGFPGVNTKRWFDGTNRERNMAILEKLKNVEKEKRKVNVVTVVALSDGKNTVQAEGNIKGYIAKGPRGENGFGFDEIIELENGKTLAELSKEEKNKISSRKKAILLLKEKMLNNNKFDF